MKEVRAAVLWPGEPAFRLESLQLEEPRAGEVLVRIAATGICHTDMVMRDAKVTPRPIVLGHEGAGVVEQLGPGVGDLQVGDHVALSFASCGDCPSCHRAAPAYCDQFFNRNYLGCRADGSVSLSRAGQPVHSHFFGQSSFATHVVCARNSLVRVDDSLPLELVGPFGCGFQAGAGAVLNSFRVSRGASVMVLGSGAVGLAAVMAAAQIAGAATVIAVDRQEARLAVAREVGATHVINSDAGDFAAAVRAVAGAGVDFVIDTTGHIPLVESCPALLAPQGTLGLVAAYRLGSTMTFDLLNLMTGGRRIQGVMEGDTDIGTFIPALLEHYRQGRFPVDRLVRYYDFEQINAAIEASERGEVIKAVVRMP